MSKPRVFWVAEGLDYKFLNISKLYKPGWTAVIEKSAYDKLVEENNQIRFTARTKLKSIIKEHKRLLKHYDDELNSVTGKDDHE